MALLALAAERAPPGVALHAVTVDHGLRAEAQGEAALVARVAARLKVSHDILTLTPGRAARQPAGGGAAGALRGAGGLGAGRGIGAVALAHTLDDQAETVLLRLARGSGVDGLSAMQVSRGAEGVRWLRPFLDVPREALREALRSRGIEWAEDASNDEPRFYRVRARAALAALAPLGIDAAGLAATARRMQRARAALEAETARALAEHARDDRGTVLVDRAALGFCPRSATGCSRIC
jgi:tRNA(Ile)-lysidine synthase